MNSNFDFKVDRAGDGVHNKSVSPACRNHYSSSLARMEEVFDCLDEQVAVSTVERKRPRNDSARMTAKRARHSGVDKEPVSTSPSPSATQRCLHLTILLPTIVVCMVPATKSLRTSF